MLKFWNDTLSVSDSFLMPHSHRIDKYEKDASGREVAVTVCGLRVKVRDELPPVKQPKCAKCARKGKE